MAVQYQPISYVNVFGEQDALAVVAWEKNGEGGTLRLETPHPRDFVRVETAPGGYTLRVTFREHRVP